MLHQLRPKPFDACRIHISVNPMLLYNDAASIGITCIPIP